MADLTFIIDPDGGGGEDYLTLNDFDTAEFTNLVTDGNTMTVDCQSTSGGADNERCDFDGWNTGASNWVKIWCNPASGYRHSGKYDATKYRLEMADQGASTRPNWMIEAGFDDFIIDGLQIVRTSISYDNSGGILSRSTTTSGTCWITNNIFKGPGSGVTNSYCDGYQSYSDGSNRTIFLINNLAYDWNRGGSGSYANAGLSIYSDHTYYLYNNTCVDNEFGIYEYCSAAATKIAKNCLCNDNSDNWYLSDGFDTGTITNLSDSGDAPGTGPINGSVLFADYDNDDFRLDPDDTVAIGAATNLYNDSAYAFQIDFQGEDRGGAAAAWDVGADEYLSSDLNIDVHDCGIVKGALV